jgi:nucleoside 2-deoxyribosyltransferase
MKLYLAAKWELHEKIQALVPRLEQMGHVVVSTWHDMTKHRQEGVDLPYDEQMKNHAWMLVEALKDVHEIKRADMIVCDETIPSQTGGREFEIGFVYGLDKPFVIVGPRRNPFHFLAVQHYDDWGDALASLEERA